MLPEGCDSDYPIDERGGLVVTSEPLGRLNREGSRHRGSISEPR